MENSRRKRNGLTWALWVGLSILGGVSVYYYPLFVLTMLAVPAVWATMAFRTHPAMLLVSAAAVFLFGCLMGFGLESSLCILGMAAPAGCLLWFAQKERMGNFQSVAFMAVLMTFGLFLIFCVPDLLSSGDPYVSIRSYFAGMPAVFAGTGLEQAAQILVSRIDEYIVACFYMFSGVYALVNVLLLHGLDRQKELPLCPLSPFGAWSTPYGYAMAMGAAGILVTFLSVSTSRAMMPALSLLLYEMWAMPLMVTGANVVYSVLGRRVPGRGRTFLFLGAMALVLALSPQFAQMALMLVGFVGVIMKRRAGKERR